VKDRVLKGGHDVPEEDQRRRYPRSVANLRTAFDLADEVILFDNSSIEGPRKIAVKDETGFSTYSPLPNWTANLEL
jgi:predicted ABC-type ATPase